MSLREMFGYVSRLAGDQLVGSLRMFQGCPLRKDGIVVV